MKIIKVYSEAFGGNCLLIDDGHSICIYHNYSNKRGTNALDVCPADFNFKYSWYFSTPVLLERYNITYPKINKVNKRLLKTTIA